MGRFEKGNKQGNRFSSNNQPKRRGRGKLSVIEYVRKVTGIDVSPQTSKEDNLKVIRHDDNSFSIRIDSSTKKHCCFEQDV